MGHPISMPKISIITEYGTSIRIELIRDASNPPKGKAIVGTLILFNTLDELISDSIIWILVELKNVQKNRPVNAYKGYLSISLKTVPKTNEKIIRYMIGFTRLQRNPSMEFL